MANLIPINLDKDTGQLVAKGGVSGGGGGPGGPFASGYLHLQTVSQVTWIVSHNGGTENVVVQIYDNSGDLVLPDRVHIVDINTVEINFEAAMDGRAHVIVFPNSI